MIAHLARSTVVVIVSLSLWGCQTTRSQSSQGDYRADQASKQTERDLDKTAKQKQRPMDAPHQDRQGVIDQPRR